MKQRLQEFLLDMDMDKKKLLFLLGGVVLTVVLLVIVLSTVLGGSGGKKYDRLYQEAETAYLAHDYNKAEKKLRSAMELDSTEQAYLLMADIYAARGETEEAIQVLYLGYSRVGGDQIAAKLEGLKSEQSGGETVPASQGTVTIAGMAVDSGASSLVLSGHGLSSADRTALSTLTQLESLSISDCGVSDLRFLSELRKLTLLQVSDNAVRDLSPLGALTGLKTLYIDNNPVSDLEPLYALAGLRTLSMKGVEVSKAQLEALKKALPNCNVYATAPEEDPIREITLGGRTFRTDVTELNLGGLGITDISALSACTKLEKLDLRENKINDISPLVELQSLQWLCLWNNEVEDIYPLLSLKELRYLDAEGNQISDISVLQTLSGLEELWLNRNPLKSLEPLRGLTGMTRLGLAGTGLDDKGLDCLMGMTELRELNIQDNDAITEAKLEALKKAIPDCVISHDELKSVVRLGDQEFPADAEEITVLSQELDDISALAQCKRLRVLTLADCGIRDLRALQGIATLEELYLSGNRVSDLAPLAGCTKLKKLDLNGNRVQTLSPLAACPLLTTLYLNGNDISDISALSALTKLTTLSLENNRISDLSALYGLTQLESLHIRGNSLTADDILALQTQLSRCVVIHDVELSQEDITGTPGATAPAQPSSGSDLRI